MRVLGIETSCDETSVAIYDDETGLASHVLSSQIAMHAIYGGVVPELASRDHIRKLLPLVQQALEEAQLQPQDITGIAYTAGPGLIGALMVGATFARTLAWAWKIPSVAIHHLEAHLFAVMLEARKPSFPFLTLLVSGGHTQLMQVNGVGEYELLGESLDDAAGEAFDKVGRLLGLSHPGGPAIAALAEQGNPTRFSFARPMLDRPGLDFSFSGLKTQVANQWHQVTPDEQTRADIAASFQEAMVDTLAQKCRRALKQTQLKQLVIAGGVGANLALRKRLQDLVDELKGEVYFPRQIFCVDNGAMVAYAGYQRLLMGDFSSDLAINVRARWPLVVANKAG